MLWKTCNMHKAMALILSMLVATLTLTLQVRAQPAPASPPSTPGSPPPTPGSALSPTYYDGLCGTNGTKVFQFFASLKVVPMVIADPTLIPALTRMCFHEGFVEGAEASILMDFNSSFPDVEKNGIPNKNSLRGYGVIDAVKSQMESICPGVISCADILQESVRIALRSLSSLSGSLQYDIRYGRRDGIISLASEALTNLPPPSFNYTQLIANFARKNFNATELMVLSGAHTFGVSHCSSFTQRLYNFYGNGSGTDPALDPLFALTLKFQCPQNATTDGIVAMDYKKPIVLPSFDNQYYKNIQDGKVLFTSDDALQKGDSAEVNVYAADNVKFRNDFMKAIVKLSELQVKLFPAGEIRANCRKRN